MNSPSLLYLWIIAFEGTVFVAIYWFFFFLNLVNFDRSFISFDVWDRWLATKLLSLTFLTRKNFGVPTKEHVVGLSNLEQKRIFVY